MKVRQAIVGVATLLVTNLALAETAAPPMELPIVSGGLFAIVAIALGTGIYVARENRKG